MGKVLSTFSNGWAGTPSRSADEIIISMQAASGRHIEFGEAVFMAADGRAEPFSTDTPQDFAAFVGFAVRVPDKTPMTVPETPADDSPAARWHADDVVEVLVRGAVALPAAVAGARGSRLYIRKSDGRLTTLAGEAGTTVELANVRVKVPLDAQGGCCEAVVLERNLQ